MRLERPLSYAIGQGVEAQEHVNWIVVLFLDGLGCLWGKTRRPSDRW